MSYDNSAAWAAAAQTANTAANVIATSNVNRKTQKWNEKVMAQQREWALADWNMQNEYNSPEAQMARYKAAGLNPHLIYGQQTSTPSVRSSEAPSFNPKAPDLSGIGNSFTAYFDTQARQAQTQLLKTQNVIAEREAQLKATQDLLLNAQLIKTRWDTELSKNLAPYQMDMKRAQIAQLDQGIMESGSRITNMTDQMALNKAAAIRDEQRLGMEKQKLASQLSIDELQRDIMSISKDKGMADIRLTNEQIDNLFKDGRMKDKMYELQLQLGKTGLTTTDGAYWKLLYQFMKNFVAGIKETK